MEGIEEESIDLSGIFYDQRHNELLLIEPYSGFPWLGHQHIVMSNEQCGIIMSAKAILDDMMDGDVVRICDL